MVYRAGVGGKQQFMDTQQPRESKGGIDRRGFVGGAIGAGGLLLGGLGGFGLARALEDDDDGRESEAVEPGVLPSGKNGDDFIAHGTSPYTLETRRDRFGSSALTASSLMFVRQNLELPDESVLDDPDGWTFDLGGVASPGEVSVADLKRLGVATVTCVIQCSGNGRGFFEHDPSGSEWMVGASANVMWTGVPVRTLAEDRGGAADGMRFLTTTGGDPLPEGIDELEAIVERSVPIDKGLEDCLLAWEMNGGPIPLANGGPLRLIVPGYYGVNHVKFVRRLAFTADESKAAIQQTGYRFRPIGVDGAPDQPSMWEMNVKSFVTSPLEDADVPSGTVRVVGVAFAGEQSIDRVEVSTDGGETWRDAELYGPDLGATAWRRFTYEFDADDGEYVIASRATDSEGNAQPEQRVENHRGYAHNGWRDHAVKVVIG